MTAAIDAWTSFLACVAGVVVLAGLAYLAAKRWL